MDNVDRVVEYAPGAFVTGGTPLDWALSKVGVTESGGPNRGPEIDVWLRFVRAEPDRRHNSRVPKNGYPWCAAFVCYACWRADRPVRRSALVSKLVERNAHLEVPREEIQPGDIVTRIAPRGNHAAFFFGHADDGFWRTVDGNTNGEGSREGNQVAVRERKAAYWNGPVLRPRPKGEGIT